MKSALHGAIATITEMPSKNFPFYLQDHLRVTYDRIIEIIKEQYTTMAGDLQKTADIRAEKIEPTYPPLKILMSDMIVEQIKNKKKIPYSGVILETPVKNKSYRATRSKKTNRFSIPFPERIYLNNFCQPPSPDVRLLPQVKGSSPRPAWKADQ